MEKITSLFVFLFGEEPSSTREIILNFTSYAVKHKITCNIKLPRRYTLLMNKLLLFFQKNCTDFTREVISILPPLRCTDVKVLCSVKQ